MKNSHIEWTDHTFNPWEGCTKVSPGCLHCYAETRNVRFSGGANWGNGAPRRRTSVQNWNQLRKWNLTAICGTCGGSELIGSDDCRHCGNNFDSATRRRPRVFCASLADWLDDEVAVNWLADLLDLIRECKNLDFQLLTKRPENWRSRMDAVCEIDGDSLAWSWLAGNAPENVWVGTTVEDQTRADERIPLLLKTPARIRFLSCEPLLSKIDLGLMGTAPDVWKLGYTAIYQLIHWVIAGGESGPGARPMHPDWARSLRDQCRDAEVPFLFKQWGEWIANPQIIGSRHAPSDLVTTVGKEGLYMQRVGKRVAGRDLDGVMHTEFPEVVS